MSIEQQPPRRISAEEQFGLTERERLWDRISHTRFMTILNDTDTEVHRVEEASNNYGEYLFVTVSRPGAEKRILMTFWGLGYHEYRERWIVEEWFWYQSMRKLEEESVPRETARAQIEERHRTIQAYGQEDTQTRRGQVFEMLADLTDEDGAYSEMEDLEDLGDWLLGDEEE